MDRARSSESGEHKIAASTKKAEALRETPFMEDVELEY
jgi:hypothetical protein